MSPVVFIGLCLAAMLLPLLVLKSAHKLSPGSWYQIFGSLTAWLWIIASVMTMGSLMLLGNAWRRWGGSVRLPRILRSHTRWSALVANHQMRQEAKAIKV
jgi:hypothetical protein